MLYLIHELIFWLLLTAIGAGVAGWGWRAWRHAADSEALARRREQLLRDLLTLVNGDPAGVPAEALRDAEMQRALLDVRDGRIADLERHLGEMRAARDEAIARAAELGRSREAPAEAEVDTLRAEIQRRDDEGANVLDVEATSADATAQRWRLAYLEARLRHVGDDAPTVSAEPVDATASAPAPAEEDVNTWIWRTRYAEARVKYLEGLPTAAPAEPAAASQPLSLAATVEPVGAEEPASAAAPVPDEMALRGAWRMRYLETRLAHLDETATQAADAWGEARRAYDARLAQAEQARASEQAAAAAARLNLEAAQADLAAHADYIAELDTDSAAKVRRLTWRARYMDARVHHLEARLGETLQARQVAPGSVVEARPVVAPRDEPAIPADLVEEEAPRAATLPAMGAERPAVLAAARFGAPDDLTLIDDVSPMLQSTLNSIGVYHFDQIAAWSDANQAWIDQYLRLRGRIHDEQWVEQAQRLARGEVRSRLYEDADA